MSAPFLWKTGTLGGGARGEGRGEAPGEAADVGEANVNGESEGEGETGVDMMPGGYRGEEQRGGGWMMGVSEMGIELCRRKTLKMGGGGGEEVGTWRRRKRRGRRRRDGKCNGSWLRQELY